MFNLGALLSALGASQNIAHRDGQRLAAQYFQRAAGAFRHARDAISARLAHRLAPHSDLDVAHLSVLESLMLAQAQQCCWERVAPDASTSQPAAQVAMAAADYFASAIASVGQSKKGVLVKRSVVPPHWKKYMDAQRAYFVSVAQYLTPFMAGEKSALGARIGRLAIALQELTAIRLNELNCKPLAALIKAQIDVLKHEISVANRKNAAVFMERTLTRVSLAPPKRMTDALVAPAALQAVLGASDAAVDTPVDHVVSVTVLQQLDEHMSQLKRDIGDAVSRARALRLGLADVKESDAWLMFDHVLALPDMLKTPLIDDDVEKCLVHVARQKCVLSDAIGRHGASRETDAALRSIESSMCAAQRLSEQSSALEIDIQSASCVRVPCASVEQPNCDELDAAVAKIESVEKRFESILMAEIERKGGDEAILKRISASRADFEAVLVSLASIESSLDAARANAETVAQFKMTQRIIASANKRLASLASQHEQAQGRIRDWSAEAQSAARFAETAAANLVRPPLQTVASPRVHETTRTTIDDRRTPISSPNVAGNASNKSHASPISSQNVEGNALKKSHASPISGPNMAGNASNKSRASPMPTKSTSAALSYDSSGYLSPVQGMYASPVRRADATPALDALMAEHGKAVGGARAASPARSPSVALRGRRLGIPSA